MTECASYTVRSDTLVPAPEARVHGDLQAGPEGYAIHWPGEAVEWGVYGFRAPSGEGRKHTYLRYSDGSWHLDLGHEGRVRVHDHTARDLDTLVATSRP
jgi:hypothetical protein